MNTKDLTYSFKPALSTGIRESYKAAKDAPVLETVVNAVAQKEGLYPFELPENPLNIANSAIFPQIFRTKNCGTYVAFENTIFSANESTDPWTLTQVFPYVPWNPAYTAIPSGGRWHIADFVNGFILYNGSCEIICYRGTLYLNLYSHAITGCYFRGRLIVAGLQNYTALWGDSNYNSKILGSEFSFMNVAMKSNWVGWSDPRGWDILSNTFPYMLLTGGSEDYYRTNFFPNDGGWSLGSGWTHATGPIITATLANTVASKSISLAAQNGHTDFLLLLPVSRAAGSLAISITGATIYAGPTTISSSQTFGIFLNTGSSTSITITLTGTGFTGYITVPKLYKVDHKENQFAVRELIKVNARGFMPMNWVDPIVRIEPMNDSILVYGENNISALIPREETFERIEVAEFGLLDRGACSGGLKSHLIVDSFGRLQIINRDHSIQTLDRRELFTPAITDSKQAQVLALKDIYDSRFFVTVNRTAAANSRSYAVTETGVSELGYLIIDTLASKSGLSNQGVVSSTITTSQFYLKTLLTNFGVPTIKLLKTLTLAVDNISGLMGRAGYRKSKDANIIYTEWKAIDGRGELDFFVNGIDFIIELKCTDYTALRIHDMFVTFNTTEGTDIRAHLRRR